MYTYIQTHTNTHTQTHNCCGVIRARYRSQCKRYDTLGSVFMSTLKTCLVAKPPFTKPPFVNPL